MADPTQPRRPYVPNSELPGAMWRKLQGGRNNNKGGGGAPIWAILVVAIVVTAVLVATFVTLLNNSGNNLAVMVGAITATPSATPTNTPTPTITPSPTPVNSDDDAIIDDMDNCDFVSNPDQQDMDGDGIGDACDDSDSDTIVDLLDNCPNDANTDQSDLDGDGRGDVCDEAVNLSGITLEPQTNTPLFMGSSASSAVIAIGGEAEAPLVITAAEGGFVPSEAACSATPAPTYTLRTDETSVRYCAPSASGSGMVRLIVREIGADDQPTGRGGFTMVELSEDTLTVSLEAAPNLNGVNVQESDRCVFLDALGDGTLLEQDAIPLILRVNVEAQPDVARSYAAIVTLPSGGLYTAERAGNTCELLTPLDPLTDSPTLEVNINTEYTLFYVPGASTGDAATTLSVSLTGRSIAPSTLAIPPVLISTIPINVRDTNLNIALSLEETVRALVTGIGGQGAGRWAQIRMDGDERELWINVGQLGGSYRVLGNLDAATPVTLPSNFGS